MSMPTRAPFTTAIAASASEWERLNERRADPSSSAVPTSSGRPWFASPHRAHTRVIVTASGAMPETRREHRTQRAVRDDVPVSQRVVAVRRRGVRLGVVEEGAQRVDDRGRLVEVDGPDADGQRRHGIEGTGRAGMYRSPAPSWYS